MSPGTYRQQARHNTQHVNSGRFSQQEHMDSTSDAFNRLQAAAAKDALIEGVHQHKGCSASDQIFIDFLCLAASLQQR